MRGAYVARVVARPIQLDLQSLSGRNDLFIKRIQIAKYRHLEGIEIGPFRAPPDGSDLIVLAGPNGGGKSSILELISLALSNMWSLTYQSNRTNPTSSYEVTIGLAPNELATLAAAKGGLIPEGEAATLEYLLEHHAYCRSFSYSDGEYAKNPGLHNRIHDMVQRVLRGSYNKPLGFFITADRSYVRKNFQRDKLFNYTNYSTFQHRSNFAFQSSNQQYEDMFDFLVTWRYHFARRLGAWYLNKAKGVAAADDEPADEYGQILERAFPGYRFLESLEDAPTDLFVEIPGGERISFADLSSGEKEVFFMLSFFQRHAVEEAVILIDEPEMHLHPSLVRVLLRAMQTVKPRNQIWLASQSSEVIEEAGRDKVFFVQRGQDQKAKVVRATDEAEALACLRDFFGYAGYLGLARAMIFTEGRNASADRKLFSRLLPGGSREIKIIPSNASSELERINRAILAILEADVGWCKFFLIRDRDYLPEEAVSNLETRSGGRVQVLKRHELENYLLVADALADVQTSLFDNQLTTDQARQLMHSAAREVAGEALRDMVAFRLNLIFRPEDFSVPQLMHGMIMFQDDQWDEARRGELRAALKARHDQVTSLYDTTRSVSSFDGVFDECSSAIRASLIGDGWLSLLPGKEILKRVAKKTNVKDVTVLQNGLIGYLGDHPQLIPTDLREKFDRISAELSR